MQMVEVRLCYIPKPYDLPFDPANRSKLPQSHRSRIIYIMVSAEESSYVPPELIPRPLGYSIST